MKSQRWSLRVSRVLSRGLSGLALSAISLTASATQAWISDYVKYVYPQADGSFVISFVNPQPTCTGSGVPQYFTVQAGMNGVTADGLKLMFATALTALAADKQVQLVFDTTTGPCFVNRMLVVGGT